MIPIYIVSLLKDVDRRNEISKSLQSLGLQYEFIDAINGKDLDENYVNSFTQKGKLENRGFKITNGELGCSLSHNKVYKLSAEKKHPWICVLEDDAIIDHRFADFINNFDSNKFDSKNLYILGGQNGIYKSKFISKSIFTHFKIGEQTFFKIIKGEEFILRACCYFISDKFIEKIVDFYKSSNVILADDWIYLAKNKYFDNIFYSDIVDHPVDLSTSNLEKERKNKQIQIDKNISFNYKIFFFLRTRILYIKSIIRRFYF